MVEYYLAEKGCSLGVQERLMIKVDGIKLEIERGRNDDKFELNKERIPSHSNWDGLSLSYSIHGPLTEQQIYEYKSKPIAYFSQPEKRVRSARRFY